MKDFNITYTFSQTPMEVFEAVVNVRGWWSAALEGQSRSNGDEFIYRHGDVHYSRHKLTEVITGKRVVWLTTDSGINFVDHKTEWTGTTIVFEIEEHNGQTVLIFTHQGLVPELKCYKGCTGGWRYYLQNLRELIVKGEEVPEFSTSNQQ